MIGPAIVKAASSQEVLVIMARYPEEGAVKTRLARDLGPRATYRLYRAFIGDLAEKFGSLHRPLIWYYVPASSPFPKLFPGRFTCRPQSGLSLQERMLRIFEDLFGEGCKRVVVIGADVPHLPVEAVDEAFASLNAVDAVFRPSVDGGYHLVGLKAVRDLFSGITMSTDRVLRDTIERAVSMGLSARCLAPSFDIDTIEDVKRLRQHLAETNDPLPRTRKVLTEIPS
ncbi:MAG TPA: TIGR04282 family arsenosugar biosynthesis glycosyltransferase [Syntrophales bacterium]|nr:TIGR04282 family arsenosugar biosynthesis glycosyltransferase [Syntrophales bacterium]